MVNLNENRIFLIFLHNTRGLLHLTRTETFHGIDARTRIVLAVSTTCEYCICYFYHVV